LVFEYVTLESLFDKELPTFDKIMSSYRSTAVGRRYKAKLTTTLSRSEQRCCL
jgi:hypothetical protein